MLTLKQYRRAAVPLLAVQTADPAGIVRLACSEARNGNTSPVLQWDCVHGVIALNAEAQQIAANVNRNGEPAMATGNPVEAMAALEIIGGDDTAQRAVIVALGMSDALTDAAVRQATWNLRDVLPSQGALLVMTVPMGWTNPFPDDIAVAVDALPTADDHKATAVSLCKDAGLDEPDDDTLRTVGDALLGLSGFASEQALALSLTKEGIDTGSLWARKRAQVSETPGLSIYSGKETFDDLGGVAAVKEVFGAMLKGKRPPGCIVFIDEGEKGFSGTQGDTSGVAQDQHQNFLTYMEDNDAPGAIFVGPPGAAKSAFSKALGNEGGLPTVILDLGGLKGSLVGQSEGAIRKALSVITAISGGRPFFVMTCNAISSLSPELKRRFKFGTFFFDLPTADERDTIWNIYVQKFGLDASQDKPASDGWTGAEIKQCCDMADRLGMSLVDAARFVVPVSVSARESIAKLRSEASGRYLSASQPGVYQFSASVANAAGRQINLD